MNFHQPSQRNRFHSVLLSLIVISGLAAAPKETNSPPRPAASLGRQEYVSFQLITDRNIFNANRTARSARGGGDEEKPNKVDTVTLVGTLSYEKGPYAFFDGSSSEFRQVLEPGKSIAGYKIAEITGSRVKMEAGTNTVELSVGMKMRREEEGPWLVVASSAPPTIVSGSSSSSESSADSSTGEESEIIKRLMQQREQEIK